MSNGDKVQRCIHSHTFLAEMSFSLSLSLPSRSQLATPRHFTFKALPWGLNFATPVITFYKRISCSHCEHRTACVREQRPAVVNFLRPDSFFNSSASLLSTGMLRPASLEPADKSLGFTRVHFTGLLVRLCFFFLLPQRCSRMFNKSAFLYWQQSFCNDDPGCLTHLFNLVVYTWSLSGHDWKII